MKNIRPFVLIMVLLAHTGLLLTAQTIWNTGSFTFVKTVAGEKDCITPQTCLTRITVLFNDVCQAVSGSQGCGYTGPCNTEWAYGSIANWNTLTYQRLYAVNECTPPGMIGFPMVLHLIAENIYLQVTFNSWQTSGGGGFSYTRTTASAVPVLLSRFAGFKTVNGNVLEWTSSSESNCSHYNIQRSFNGIDFAVIGRVNSRSVNGHSSTDLDYRFIDPNAPAGYNYYRLEQWDIDGTKSYSSVLVIQIAHNGSRVWFSQNPVSDRVNVFVNAEISSKGRIRVSDLHGRILKEVTAPIVNGTNTVQVELGNLAAGIYVLQFFEHSALRFSGKLVKPQ